MDAQLELSRDRTQSVLLVVAVALAAPMLGLMTALSPKVGIAALISIWFIAGFSRSDTFALCAFSAAIYFEIITMFTGATLSPIKLTGASLIVVALVALVAERSERPPPGWSRHPIAMLAMTAYIAWAVASVAWAQDASQVKTLSTRLLTEVLVLLAVGIFLQRPRQLRWLAWTILSAATIATVIGLLFSFQLEGRAIGTFRDPNEYAASLVPALALGYVLIDDASSRVQASVAALMSAICAYGLIGSQSRGGLLAAITVGGVLFVTSRGRERFRLVGVGLVGICFLVAVLFVTAAGQGLLDRVSSTDTSGRSDLWKVAMKQFEAQPLTGVGLGNYPVVSKEYLDNDIHHRELFLGEPRTTHNVTLELMAELGIPGVVFFYTLVISSMMAAYRTMRQGRADPTVNWSVPYARATLASICGLVVAGIFISGQYQELLWVMMGVSFALSGIVARRVDVRGDEHSEPISDPQ